MTLYRYDLEITHALLRRVPADAPPFAPFDRLIGVVGDEGEAILKGLTGDIDAHQREAINATLWRYEFKTARWWRHLPDGSRVARSFNVKPPNAEDI